MDSSLQSWKGFPFNWEGGAGHLFQVPTVDPKRAMTLSIQKVPESQRNGDIWERPSKDLLVELFLGDLPNSYSDVVLMLLTAAMQRIELDVVEGGIFKQGDCLVARYYVNQGGQYPEIREETPELLHDWLMFCMEDYWGKTTHRLTGNIKNSYDEIVLDMDLDNHIDINPFGPTKSLLTVDAHNRLGLLYECFRTFIEFKVHVEVAKMEIRAWRALLTFEISDDGKALDEYWETRVCCWLHRFLKRNTNADDYFSLRKSNHLFFPFSDFKFWQILKTVHV